MSCYCDYEMPDFFNEALHKARKAHMCDECLCDIKIGETYKRSSGKWDGRVDSYKQCQKCLGLIEYMKAHIKCFCWAFGQLIGDAYETVQGYGSEASTMKFQVYRHKVRRKKGWLAYKAKRDAAKNLATA